MEERIKQEIEDRYRKYRPQHIVVSYDKRTKEGSASFYFDAQRKSVNFEIRSDDSIYFSYGPEDEGQDGLDLNWRPSDDPLFGLAPCCKFGMEKFSYGNPRFKILNAKTANEVGWVDCKCSMCGSNWRYDQNVSPAKWVRLPRV